MYEKHWGLKEKPFENTPDPRFLYHSPQHEEALSRLIYVVREGKGAGMMTGIFGCGKTLLGRALLAELEKDVYRVGFVTNPRMEDVELLRMIAHALGAAQIPERKSDILMLLETLLINNLSDGKKTVLVLDEAHTIEDRNVFEEVRLLLNFQREDRFLLTLLILGQPELKERIEANKQLLQRIAMRFHLEALNGEDTLGYIRHRLKVSGAREEVFDESAARLCFERAAGIPRRINQICDMALLTGFSQKKKRVDESLIKEAAESLGGET